MRGRSIETIKVQAKAILRKTSCSRMSDVVELSASVAYLLRQNPAQEEPSKNSKWEVPVQDMHILERPKGRQIAYYQYGKGDTPVLFIHGYLFGPFFTKDFLTSLQQENLYIIAPSRAGFGFSSPSGSRRDYNATVVSDAVALVEHLGLENIVIAAHQGGVSHAFRIAKAIEGRVKAMVMIGAGVPIDEEKHVPHMEAHSRIGAVTARHAPSVLKMMTRLSLQMYKRQGMDVFLRKFYAKAPIDLATLGDPEIFQILLQGTYHISQHGAEVWVRDGMSAMGDWAVDMAAVSCHQSWIHGAHCPVLAAHFVEEYVAVHTDFKVEVSENAGANLLYQEPDQIIRQLAQAAAVKK